MVENSAFVWPNIRFFPTGYEIFFVFFFVSSTNQGRHSSLQAALLILVYYVGEFSAYSEWSCYLVFYFLYIQHLTYVVFLHYNGWFWQFCSILLEYNGWFWYFVLNCRKIMADLGNFALGGDF